MGGLFGYISRGREQQIERQGQANEMQRHTENLAESKRKTDLDNWQKLQEHAINNLDAQLAKMSPSSPGYSDKYALRSKLFKATPGDPNNDKLWDEYGLHHQVHPSHVEGLNDLTYGQDGKPTGPALPPGPGQAPGGLYQAKTGQTQPFMSQSRYADLEPPPEAGMFGPGAGPAVAPNMMASDPAGGRTTASPMGIPADLQAQAQAYAHPQAPPPIVDNHRNWSKTSARGQSAYAPPEGVWNGNGYSVPSPNVNSQISFGPPNGQVDSTVTYGTPGETGPQQMMPPIKGNGQLGIGAIPDIPSAPGPGPGGTGPGPGGPRTPGSFPVTGAEGLNLPPAPPPPNIRNPHAIQPQGAAQPSGNPIAGHGQIQLPPPAQMQQAPAMHQAPPSAPGQDLYSRDMAQYGYTSPDLQQTFGPPTTHQAEAQYGQSQMQAGIEHMKQTGQWDRMPPLVRGQMEFEAYGGKPVPFAAGLARPITAGSRVGGDQGPAGQLDAYGSPLRKDWDYHVQADPLDPSQQTWQPIGPQTVMTTGLNGQPQSNNKRTGTVSGTMEGAQNPAFAPTTTTTSRLADIDGKKVEVPITSTRKKGSAIESAPGQAPPPIAGGTRVLGDSQSTFRMKNENPITAPGQKLLQASDVTMQNVNKAISYLEKNKLTKDNTPFGEAEKAILYKFGIADGEGSEFLNTLNIGDLQAASAILPPGQRAVQVLNKALVHTPNQWDSHEMMYKKLQNIKDNLTEVRASVQSNMRKYPNLGPSPVAGNSNSESVPDAVKRALSGVGVGKHTLSDGSVWVKNSDGSVTSGK